MMSLLPNPNMINFTDINQNEFKPPLSTNDFLFEKELGHGAFGSVYKAKFKRNGKIYALKQYQKSKIHPEQEIDLLREKVILYDLTKRNFPYIVKLYADFEDFSAKYLVMELTTGTKLEDLRGYDNFQGYVSQDLVIVILIQILQTLNFLHDTCKIIHRDIKPDNIILCKDNNIKLLDFGLSVYLNHANNNLVTRHSLKGALRYVPPEILMVEPRDYDSKIDIFSLGFTMYSLMNPVQNNQENNLPHKTIKKEDSIVRFEQSLVNNFYDPQLINFVKSLYENNPKKRPTAFQALNNLQILLNQTNISSINFNNNIFNIFTVNPMMMNKIIISSSSKQLGNYPSLNQNNNSNLNRLNSEVNIQKKTHLDEFLNPTMEKQNKIMSSMKSLLQVLFRLDQMKLIQYQIYNLFSNCQLNYTDKVLHYFYEMINTIQKLENNEVNLDYYNLKINEFIRVVLLNNESDMSGTRPIILYYMMLSIFVDEFNNYFNVYQNYILDDYINSNYITFNNIIPMNIPQVYNSISQTIIDFKNNYKGPFVDNFNFLILSVSICPKCSSFFGCRCKVGHFLQLDVPNQQNNISQLINNYFSPKKVFGQYSCQCGLNGEAIRKIFCLNLPNYLFMEFEDKNYINFQDTIILSSLKETNTYQYYAGIYKYKNNNVSNFVAVIKSGNGYILYNDDKITPCQPNMVNLECPSLAVYKKIINK